MQLLGGKSIAKVIIEPIKLPLRNHYINYGNAPVTLHSLSVSLRCVYYAEQGKSASTLSTIFVMQSPQHILRLSSFSTAPT